MNRQKITGLLLIAIGTAGFTFSIGMAIKIHREQRNHLIQTIRNMEANVYAYKTSLRKAYQGEYDGMSKEEIENDYKFHQIMYHLHY